MYVCVTFPSVSDFFSHSIYIRSTCLFCLICRIIHDIQCVCWWSLSLSMTQETRQYRKAARDNQVVMYRQYREGELPDIQIKYSELIRPLQALAQVGGWVWVWVGELVCVYLCVHVTVHLGETVYSYSTYSWVALMSFHVANNCSVWRFERKGLRQVQNWEW